MCSHCFGYIKSFQIRISSNRIETLSLQTFHSMAGSMHANMCAQFLFRFGNRNFATFILFQRMVNKYKDAICLCKIGLIWLRDRMSEEMQTVNCIGICVNSWAYGVDVWIATRKCCKITTDIAASTHSRTHTWQSGSMKFTRIYAKSKKEEKKPVTLKLQLFVRVKAKKTTHTHTQIGFKMLIQSYVISSDFSMNLFKRFSECCRSFPWLL